MKDVSQKQKRLDEIKELLDSGVISTADLLALTSKDSAKPKPVESAQESGRSRTLGAALYVVGAVIVCVGLAVMIGQSWDLLNTTMRIVLSFGLGILFLAVGALFKRKAEFEDMLAETVLVIGGVAIMLGSGVIAHESGYSFDDPLTVTVLALLLTLLYVVIYILLRSPTIAFLGLISVVTFFYGLTSTLLGDSYSSAITYTTMFNGAWLIVAGLVMKRRAVLGVISGITQGFGGVFLLGAAMIEMISNGSFSRDISSTGMLWPFIYPLLLALMVYVSITVRSKGLMLTSSIFLTFYILYISSKYFSDVLGWPFSLMIAGVAMIAVAASVRKLNKRYSLH